MAGNTSSAAVHRSSPMGSFPTLQAEPAFGRVYAATGGIFIVLSILWSTWVDGWRPDRFDLLGAAVALIGALVIMWGRD